MWKKWGVPVKFIASFMVNNPPLSVGIIRVIMELERRENWDRDLRKVTVYYNV